MTILFVTDSFAIWGGIERVLANKMNFLADVFGYDIHFVTASQGLHAMPYGLSAAIHHTDLNVRFHTQYRFSGIARLRKALQLHRMFVSRLREYIERVQPDIIVTPNFELAGGIRKAKGVCPLVVEVHSIFRHSLYERPSFLRNLYNQYCRLSVYKADMIVTLTQADAKDWRRKSSRVTVIPNAVTLNDSGTYATGTSPSVIFVGRFETQKDIGSLFRIWKLVHQRHPDWYLDLYGDGEQKAEFTRQAGILQANIRIHEPASDIFDKYRHSSLLVLTSLYEPFGLVLPEAMSCGLPVVSFGCPYGPADIVTDGVNGFIVADRNIEAFADRVCTLIEDELLRRQMGQAAVRAAQRYRLENIMPLWKELFEKVARQ